MLTNIIIIALSAVLLLYWFRYTCLLILSTKPFAERGDSVGPIWVTLSLGRSRVGAAQTRSQLDQLSGALERDYRLLTYLLKHTTGLEVGGLTLEQRMLMLDFRLMQIWYRLTRVVLPLRSRKALEEMSDILACFTEALLERNPQAIRSSASA